jgi:nicotinamide mononucleotide transporter
MMMTELLHYFSSHTIEVVAAFTGILSVLFQIRQNVLVWFFGIVASLLYTWVFFYSRLYALMSLQAYYIAISIYGWVVWVRKKKQDDTAIRRLSFGETIRFFLILAMLSGAFFLFLSRYTDSIVPFADAFITASCLVASYMLAHKYLEQWLVWLVVDVISIFLYFYQHLYSTVVFSIVLSVMAVVGFSQWKKQWQQQ